MPSSLKKLSHTVYECKNHIIWCPKYRFRVMDVEVRFYVRDVIRRLCEWKRLTIIQGNVQKDHVHLVLEIPPNQSVSFVAGLESGSSNPDVPWREPDSLHRKGIFRGALISFVPR
ncbi:MAG: IS200/IS605 family transposase [Fibrobacteraceae bacterium]|nr:IS200/IS605 family transposase [Fibrobacteraceae bacterium]